MGLYIENVIVNTMDVKDLVQKELELAKYEFQLKIKADVKEDDIWKLGAEKKGSVLHEDRYFIPKGKQASETNELIRVRKEGDEKLLFTYKGPVANRRVRNRLVINKPIQEKEALDIKKNYNEIVIVNKKRTIFLLDSVVINLDWVENLGTFIEFEVTKERDCYKIGSLIKKLGLEPKNSTRLSYFELALMDQSPMQRIFVKIYNKFGKFSFGIPTAVLVMLGIVVGLNSAVSSQTAVISVVVVVAVINSLSNSMGEYTSRKAERSFSSALAFRSSVNYFLGSFVFSLSFIIPFIIFPFSLAIYTCIVWGLILLAFVNTQIAFIHEESIPKTVIKNILIAMGIVVVSYFIGRGVTLIT